MECSRGIVKVCGGVNDYVSDRIDFVVADYVDGGLRFGEVLRTRRLLRFASFCCYGA